MPGARFVVLKASACALLERALANSCSTCTLANWLHRSQPSDDGDDAASAAGQLPSSRKTCSHDQRLWLILTAEVSSYQSGPREHPH